MPIQISQYVTKPAVAINEVHLVQLRIDLTEEQNSKAKVQVVYKLFGRDENGVKHFDPAQYVIEIEDAYAKAYADAQQGDMTLAQALGGIEVAIAALVEQAGNVGDATVV